MNWWILAAKQPVDAGANPWGMGLMWLLFLGIFWVFLIMPQRKQQKQRDAMLKNLKKGDKVITVGGVHGEITDFDGDEDLRIRVTDKVELKVTRASVAKVKS
ncbi:preprotein translocase subunit YajC [Hydrogenispora ethanolica]|jgi:preprotein translocase subunit YajC|uniref:Preprotein translocase subunit YajC n=1 Tax=Hydrogenispora ethanolica TaxID=1082276 RepID=A0A4R1RGX2_HYDET|nr:preprotein translocase subunit YajC [Hydrogenispora ethanolica]TCL65285.1 preprotein translocase subunit YajC [Hydrogenispora ethanolica]